MPLYVADYLSKTGHLSTVEHGAYMLLIMQYWTQESLPDNDKILSQITRLRVERWKSVRPQLEPFFTIELGRVWRHSRIDDELKKAADLREKRRGAAAARWCNSNANAVQMHAQPQPPSQEQKIVSLKGFIVGKGKGEMSDENKIALFQKWLAELIGKDGWTIVGKAADPFCPEYDTALAFCKNFARQNGKGWPHKWPKKSSDNQV